MTKCVLITGASKGIGREAASYLPTYIPRDSSNRKHLFVFY